LITAKNIDISQNQKVTLYQDSSLNVFPKLVESSIKFNVILLDGDHNYYTVKKELEYLDSLTQNSSLVIIDDYHGRWAEKDLWYSTREGYESVKNATLPVDTDKHGVKPAVDDFLTSNNLWESSVLIQGEPIVLRRRQREKGIFEI
jgi:hypothetical protein